MEHEQAQTMEGASAPGGPTSPSGGYELPVPDTSRTPASLADFFAAFFAAKNSHSPDETMKFFSRELETYTDSTLGLALYDFDGLYDLFAEYMPNWGEGRSYPVRILGGPSSAVVAFTDTPELFGGELHLLGAVDLAGGKIVWWVDYWDTSGFERASFDEIRTPDDVFPNDFKDTGESADASFADVARGLHAALSEGNAERAEAFFTYDAVYEDMALRTQLIGRSAIGRYLGRALEQLPLGPGSTPRHVVGGGAGGGLEWTGSAASGVRRGITALELDARGRISRLTVCYDGQLLADDAKKRLVEFSLERL